MLRVRSGCTVRISGKKEKKNEIATFFRPYGIKNMFFRNFHKNPNFMDFPEDGVPHLACQMGQKRSGCKLPDNKGDAAINDDVNVV